MMMMELEGKKDALKALVKSMMMMIAKGGGDHEMLEGDIQEKIEGGVEQPVEAKAEEQAMKAAGVEDEMPEEAKAVEGDDELKEAVKQAFAKRKVHPGGVKKVAYSMMAPNKPAKMKKIKK